MLSRRDVIMQILMILKNFKNRRHYLYTKFQYFFNFSTKENQRFSQKQKTYFLTIAKIFVILKILFVKPTSVQKFSFVAYFRNKLEVGSQICTRV